MNDESNLAWRAVAAVVSHPRIATWLIARAQRTPYYHLTGYMGRWWLFNGTPPLCDGKGRRFEWLPSIRIHHILRADGDRHPHNHPWRARTFVLRGWYIERRDAGVFIRSRGATAALGHDEFHHIESVGPGGVWTMFVSWKWRHVWGFRTPDGVVPWRKYLGLGDAECLPPPCKPSSRRSRTSDR